MVFLINYTKQFCCRLNTEESRLKSEVTYNDTDIKQSTKNTYQLNQNATFSKASFVQDPSDSKRDKSKQNESGNSIPVIFADRTLSFKSKEDSKQEQKNIQRNNLNFVDYTNNYRVITQEEIDAMSILTITEESGNILNHNEYKINAGGLINNERNSKDGVTVFGKKKCNENNAQKCDIVLNYDENKYGTFNDLSYFFSIYYKRESKQYYLRALSHNNSIENSLIFIQICNNYKYPLKEPEILNIGNYFFQITPTDTNIEIINLTKQGNSKQSLNKKPTIASKSLYNKEKKKIIIGRDNQCDIILPKEKGISRFQCSFEFDEKNNNWTLSDGNKKESMNGTWLLALRSFPIYNGMIFEILGSRIKCSLQKGNIIVLYFRLCKYKSMLIMY